MAIEDPRQLLIVEDDAAFARTLARSFERRDYAVRVATGLEQVIAQLESFSPGYAVVDLKLSGEASGLAEATRDWGANEKLAIEAVQAAWRARAGDG